MHMPLSAVTDSISILKDSQMIGKCVFTLLNVAKMLSKVVVSTL